MQINLLENTELHNIILGENGLESRKGLQAALRYEDIGVIMPRTSAGTRTEFVFGFSVESATSGQVFHYIFSKENKKLYQSIYDEQFICLSDSYLADLNADLEPFSYAVNYNQIIVNSRSLPYPLWGFIGGTLVKAEKVDSINPDTPALTLFPGRVCSFADRFVWAYANQIIINDPGTEPRTICAPNAISFGGTVLDLFQAGQGGNLIVICTDAAYQIPPDGLAGYQFQGFVSKVPGYQGVQSNNAASARGSVVGLVKDGIIDIGSFQRKPLTTYRRTRKNAKRVGPYSSGDYRIGSILPIEEGFVVSINDKSAIVDLDTGKITWIYAQEIDNMFILGILKDADGKDLYMTKDAVYDVFGNVDIKYTPTNAVLDPIKYDINQCHILVNVPTNPELSPVIREITVGCDRPTTVITTYLKNSEVQATVPVPNGSFNVIGTNVWTGSNTLIEREYRSRRMQRAVRIDSPDFEISFDCSTKIDNTANIVSKGIGKTRPSN